MKPEFNQGSAGGGWIRIAGFIVLLLLLSGSVRGQEGLMTSNPKKVEAGYLRNFAHYVGWPANAFASGNSPWHIGVLGNDPFGDILEKTFAGRTEHGRSFEIIRAGTPAELSSCQIVFIAETDAKKRRAALAKLKGKPVLTVSDAPGFLEEGGIIGFAVGERVEMRINLDEARAASLTVQTKMLEVSREVLENGVIRKRNDHVSTIEHPE